MRDYAVVAVPEQGAELVLGMTWHTILGSQLAVRARKKAREVKASHYAQAGERSEAVGTVRFKRHDVAPRGVIRYCAALAFAAGHARGWAALCVPLPDGRAWLVAVHDGKVLTQSDRLYDALGEAHGVLQELVARHGDSLAVYGVAPDHAAEPFDLAQLVPELKAALALRPSGFSLPSVPRPVWVAVVGGALAFGARGAWDLYRTRSTQPEVRVAGPEAAAQAWTASLASLAARTRVHEHASLLGVLDALQGLPHNLGGWGLRSARCEPQVASGWRCSASYLRDSRLATNASFIAARPAHWSENWRPLDAVVASFELEGLARPLDIGALPRLAEQDEYTLTELQQILPAFTGMSLGEVSSLRADVPVDASGMSMKPAADMPVVGERTIGLEGPLRSLALLPPSLSGHVAWRRIELRLDDDAQAGLNRSRLMASAQGVLYAKR